MLLDPASQPLRTEGSLHRSERPISIGRKPEHPVFKEVIEGPMRLKSRERHGSTHPHIEICGWCSWSSSLCSDGPVTKSTDSDRQVPSGMTARGRQSEQTYTNIYMHWVYPITSNSLLAVAGNRTDPIHAHIQHINYLYSQIYFF